MPAPEFSHEQIKQDMKQLFPASLTGVSETVHDATTEELFNMLAVVSAARREGWFVFRIALPQEAGEMLATDRKLQKFVYWKVNTCFGIPLEQISVAGGTIFPRQGAPRTHYFIQVEFTPER